MVDYQNQRLNFLKRNVILMIFRAKSQKINNLWRNFAPKMSTEAYWIWLQYLMWTKLHIPKSKCCVLCHFSCICHLILIFYHNEWSDSEKKIFSFIFSRYRNGTADCRWRSSHPIAVRCDTTETRRTSLFGTLVQTWRRRRTHLQVTEQKKLLYG